MDKSSNIRHKSTKIMLIVYRLFLKLSLACLILAGFVVYDIQSIDLQNSIFIFAITSSLIFALSYILTYYLYKLYNKNKFETVKKDPLKTQIMLMSRFVIFVVGMGVFLGGVSLTFTHWWGWLLVAFSLVLCEMLFSNRRLTSHLSTFCENLTAGVAFGYIYYSTMHGFDIYILAFWGISLVLLFLQELFYHLTNVSKHSKEDLNIKELINIRVQYFIRNVLIYTIIYIFADMMALLGLYDIITGSSVATIFFQLLPLIISIITVVILFYTTFHKESTLKTPNYNTVSNENDFKLKLQMLNSEKVNNAYDYVVTTMNKKNGYIRKSGEDYYYHCLNTANILLENGVSNESAISTALLHDCLEDVKECTPEIIKSLTSDGVFNSVKLLTKSTDVDYQKDDNMLIYLDNILSDRDATMVKIADRMHNMSTLSAGFTEIKKSEKREESKKYFIPFIKKAIDKYPSDKLFLDTALNFFELI